VNGCAQHIHANVQAKFGQIVSNLFQSAAQSKTEGEFFNHLSDISIM
jgi:hypothetical protein